MNMRRHTPNPMLARVLLALSLAAPALSVQAASCPSEDFEIFAQAYVTQPKVRQAHTRLPLWLRQVALEKGKLVEHESNSKSPWDLLNTALKSPEIVTRLPHAVLLRDHDGETLRILAFERKGCWFLDRLEDWSLGALGEKSDAPLGERAYQRGNRYKELALKESSSTTVALLEAALASYLQGAREGSAKAAYAAAGLSLSGEAPRLDNSRIQSLLESAAPTIPEAGLTLANFYCDQGDYDTQRPCANPQASLNALLGAARLGLPDALAELGGAYAAGTIAPQDPKRALSCYQQASARGGEGLEPSIQRLRNQGVTADNTVPCL
ncbi:hypothetical protein H681_03805 [Pseudomonas sp. ATCC 13867]|uniref:SEL1-like repeat protein n=1 Tax=Pseudomonas sp. ATCC 13867 TaxID=1294143 RepID=UPI0002C4E26E|nr:SEL1-like repeat protein [Pseudomonas sp. ATCC 13867]AGI22643.1 hypothetical protein H681_03805 [Pseudomonas sp. ATCC 13867]RFQ35436.1 sel1 repeat family protein [Pseudomonas sp. ATCC 13867]